jgi:hypothetical protein
MAKAKAEKPRTINVHLDEETHRRLRTLSASSGVTYAKVIAMGLRLVERQTSASELEVARSEPPAGSDDHGVQGDPATAFGTVVAHETASEPADPVTANDTEPAPPRDDDAWLADLNELFEQV